MSRKGSAGLSGHRSKSSEGRQWVPSTPYEPYSFAGPRKNRTEAPSLTSREQAANMTSHVSRNDHHEPNQDPSPTDSAEAPIWGLAAPLPRIQRRRASSQNEVQEGNADWPQHPSRDQGGGTQPNPPTGYGPVPQIEVTPSRHQIEPERGSVKSAETKSSRQSRDLLRQATTANLSSYHPEEIGTGGQELPRLNDATVRNRHRLSKAHVSAHDKAVSSTTPSESAPSTDAIHDVDKTANPVGENVLHESKTESEIESARRRVQEIADTAHIATDSVAQQYGPHIDWEEYQQHDSASRQSTRQHRQPQFFNSWGKVRHKLRQPFAEWLGTVVFMVIGLSGSVVHMTSENDYENILAAYLTWGFGVMIGIYIAGGISGAHLNPALSIVLSVYRGFPWSLCWQYIIAQILGAITASGIVYGLYKDAIMQYAAADIVRAGPAFYTQPREGLSDTAAFFTEFVATGIAAGSVLALGDEMNAPPGAGMHAFIIGLLVTALCMAFSYNTGTALNPARDLGPRLIVWAAGFGSEVMTLRSFWFIWGPWCGTISGALFGAAVYDIFIFVGGESPINYPIGTISDHLAVWREARGKSRTGRGRDKEKDVHDIDDVA